LDEDGLRILIDVLLEIKRSKTIIMVTHDQRLIGICDFVIKLNNSTKS